jgi:hypothetical protein
MRFAFSFVLLSGLAATADDDTPVVIPKDPDPRFGVASRVKAYPQPTARRALESVIEACEKEDYAYLAAHLLDPGFVGRRVADRARQYEGKVEADLIKLRDYQYANPDLFPNERVPLDKVQFAALVQAKAAEQGFRQLVRDVQQKLRDDPEALRDMKKVLRDGTFVDDGGSVKAVHPTVKDKTLFLKKIGDRWFIENRQEDEVKKEP